MDLGKPKGNCDADLVLQVVCDSFENNFERAVIVTSDGDYAGLIRFLMKKDKLSIILSPSIAEKCSVLLKRTSAKITYLNDQKLILGVKNEKTPDKDRTL